MITLLTVWTYLRYPVFSSVFKALEKVPLKIWIAVAAFLMVLYYGYWKERQGFKACQIVNQQAIQKEKDRQQSVIDQVLNESVKLALEAQKNADLLERQAQDALAKVKKLEAANAVCLPSSVTNSLRRIGNTKPKN